MLSEAEIEQQKMHKELYKKYDANKFIMVKVNGKLPCNKEWQNKNNNDKYFDESYNIGIQTGERSGIIVIDFDTKRNDLKQLLSGSDILSELMNNDNFNLLKFNKTPMVISGGLKSENGKHGKHYYFKYSNKYSKLKSCSSCVYYYENGIYKKIGIDIRTNGGFIVAPPSVHLVTNNYYHWRQNIDDYSLQKIPKWFFKLLTNELVLIRDENNKLLTMEKNKTDLLFKSNKIVNSIKIDKETFNLPINIQTDKKINDSIIFDQSIAKKYKNLDEKRDSIMHYIMLINKSRVIEYDNWIKLGIIIKNELGENGLEIWKDLSKQNYNNYNEAEHNKKWYTFDNKNSKKKLSIKTLIKWTKEDSPEIFSNNKYVDVDKLFTYEIIEELNERYKNKLAPIYDAEQLVSWYDIISEITNLQEYSLDYVINIIKMTCAYIVTPSMYVLKTFFQEHDKISIKYELINNLNQYNKKLVKIAIYVDEKKYVFEYSLSTLIERYSWIIAHNSLKNVPTLSKENNNENISKLNYFNLFTGFITFIDDDLIIDMDLIKPILWHIQHIWCCDNKELNDYTLNWFSHIFQKPHIKTQVMILLRSQKEGAGKGIICDFVGKMILGEPYNYVSLNGPKHILERFNSISASKILTFCDETKIAANYEYINKLKSLITQSTICIECKGKDPIVMEDYNNYIMATNDEQPVKVDLSDRRLFCLEVSENKIGDRIYFNKLTECIKNPTSGQHFYNYLYRRDISQFQCQNIPETPYKLKLKIKSLKKPIIFILEFITDTYTFELQTYHKSISMSKKEINTNTDDNQYTIPATILYDAFLDWNKANANNDDLYDKKTYTTIQEFSNEMLKSKIIGEKTNKISYCKKQMQCYVFNREKTMNKIAELLNTSLNKLDELYCK
jgi:hypothetical protein